MSGEHDALFHEQLHDVALARTESDANPDLVRAPTPAIRHESVDPEAGEEHGGHGEPVE